MKTLRSASFRIACGLVALTAFGARPALADDAVPANQVPADKTPVDQTYAINGQSTFTVQATPGFHAPYAGGNSLAPNQARETFDATIYAGFRPWRGAEIWANPEIDQGFGLSNTLGVAGFTSGEAYKVGKSDPYFKLPRLFLRQVIDLGGDASPVDAAPNQLGGHKTTNGLILTVGKISVVDIFDTNSYAHDPRGDFLNWSLIDAGSFDYAANAWGFTFGGVAEYYRSNWTLRAGLFDLSKVPNQPSLETGFGQYQVVGEFELRPTISGRAGAIRFGGWLTRGRLVVLANAVAVYDQTGSIPALASLRQMTDKWGGYINVEQELSPDLGLFARVSASNGKTEADDFTDIDRSISVGGEVKGALWGRKDDRAGLASAVNAITREHQLFLADGGLGTLVGDGQLPHPGDEWLVEGWYSLAVIRHFTLTADYQFVLNPAYNRDRGPVNVFALRLHGAF